MPTPRRCENWLLSYRDYILPRTDAPESYVFWSGVFTLSAAIRRKVWIPKKYLGVWACYPYIYLMFVGPPGARKTTSIDNGSLVLLNQVDGVNVGADAFTKEGIIESMQRTSDSSVAIVLGEFSDAMQKAGKDRSGMYEFLTSLFDGKGSYKTLTKTQGSNFLEKPCINFFSATTPGWIKDHMPESVISGGFASRVIFVYEEGPRLNKMFFDDVQGPFAELESALLEDLIHISKELSGEFSFSEDGLRAAREWSEKPHSQKLLNNDKLGGYLNRKKTHVAKLAQIHSIATKDELVITKEDWDFGVYAIETTELGLEKIFAGVGKNPYTVEIERIVAFVRSMNFYTKARVPRHEIIRNFGHSAEPRKLNDLLQYAVDSRMLKVKERWEDGNMEYDLWVPDFENMNA
jgi:hypothetical protein